MQPPCSAFGAWPTRTLRLALGLAALFAFLLARPTLASEPDAPDSLINRPERPVAIKLHAELGFLATLSHRLQLGTAGSDVNVRKELGQDTLFPFVRFSGDIDIGRKRRHTISLLWQPLNLESSATVDRNLVIEGVAILPDRPLDFRYGFSFWRISYLYDFLGDDRELAIGLALQIRNANIEYATQDGEFFRSVRDVGPVPLLKFRGRGYLYNKFWMGGEIDGFYAPIKYLNGGKSDVIGAILDSSLKFGVSLKHGFDPFIGLRYLFGGAQGTSSSNNAEPYSEGYTKNWLHFFIVSVGVSLH